MAAAAKKWDNLPTFEELPNLQNYTGCAWDVWGNGDQLGTINMLTDEVVTEAAKEIKTGRRVALNWPINFPTKPVFRRKTPEINIISKHPGSVGRDDVIYINTQSGTQWDGLRHFGVLEHGLFYGGLKPADVPVGSVPSDDPLKVDQLLIRNGIHNWAQRGIVSRGVLLDLVSYYTRDGGKLPYDPWTTSAITVKDLEEVAAYQGVMFRQGDILLLRVGFMQRYYASSQEEKDQLGAKPETFTGIEQSEEMKSFIWNNHFAAIGSDQPALERWPPPEGLKYMHETILGLWGMPIGEFFDLEQLSEVCKDLGRYTFFLTSWPLNILGGCASPPNAAAIF